MKVMRNKISIILIVLISFSICNLLFAEEMADYATKEHLYSWSRAFFMAYHKGEKVFIVGVCAYTLEYQGKFYYLIFMKDSYVGVAPSVIESEVNLKMTAMKTLIAGVCEYEGIIKKNFGNKIVILPFLKLTDMYEIKNIEMHKPLV